MTSIDLLGDDVLAGLVAAARRVPGVGDAAAVVRAGMRTGTPANAPAPAPLPAAATTVAAEDDDADRPLADLDGGPVPIPEGAPATLQEALRAAAELAPDKGTVFITQDRPDALQTYPQLLAEAERVLAGLRAAGLRPGDAALFVFDDNRCYLTAFWACVLGGFVPTPVAVATTYDAPDEANRKLHNAWKLLTHPVLLTDAATAGPLAGVRTLWAEPAVRILTVEALLEHPPAHDWFPATPDSPVLNLLTSGSTGVPKCVHHTNASVVARSYAVARHCGLTGEDVSLIWMPFDHVTVAMYNVRDVFLRCMHVNARTRHFLGDCLLWLDWIDRYRVTNTWAPNFAFTMVNERAAEIPDRSWDLSCVREMTNAGEPVIAGTSHRFLDLLAPHGLAPGVMTPCWGMSETCSGVTYTRQDRNDRTAGTVAIDPASLSRTVRHLDPGHDDAVVLSTVGGPIPGVRLRVVDDTGAVLPEDRMGELCIRGATMKHSYFGNPEAQRESYDADGWFHTGDLAFVHGGEVVIAGRIKDQIIVRGINYLAHELESVVERVDGVRVTCSAAVGLREPGAGTDQVVVFFVPERWDVASLAAIAADVRGTLGREVGLAPDRLVPVTEAEFPKTGNGKKQRAELVSRLRAGVFADRELGAPDGAAASSDPASCGPAGADAEDAGAADIWLVRRQWTELPAAPARAGCGGPGGVRLVLAGEDDRRHLGAGPADIVAGRVGLAGRGDGFAEDGRDDGFAEDGRGDGFAENGPGDGLVEDGPGRFRVVASDRAALRRLLSVVTERHGPLSTVVYALPLAGAPQLETVTAELTALLSALADGGSGAPQVLVLTAGSVYVRPGDRVDLATCALPGLVRTAAAETTSLRVRQVDLPADRGAWADALAGELADRGRTGIVAVRHGRRWRPGLTPVGAGTGAGGRPPVVDGGVYLVTGGLGGIAHEIGTYLVAARGARLLLVGRSAPAGEKADRLAELRDLGDVVYERLDVADAGALEAAVAAAEARWGRPLDGVLHLAGADPTAGAAEPERHTVVNERPEAFAAQYRAKVAGTLAVADVLDRRPDASLVLFGSVNGEFGGHAFGAYAAANSFLAGFAEHWHHERGRAVQCLAWSMWTGVGMSRTQSPAAAGGRGFRAIGPDDGLRLFLEAIEQPHPYLIIGLDLTHPAIVADLAPDRLQAREVVLAYVGDGVGPDAVRAAVAPGFPVPVRPVAVAAIARGADGAVDTVQLLRETARDRPERVFVEPVGELERQIATTWSDALGRPAVGREDSFFELGGNSLRAVRLLALMDSTLAVRMTTRQLYENPTVAGLAALIARQGTEVPASPEVS